MHSREIFALKSKLIGLLAPQTENSQESSLDKIEINYICFQKIQPNIKKLLEDSFHSLKEIKINNCDLRTFQNFPTLSNLTDLNVSKNSIGGTFEYLLKNKSLVYIDVSDNIISDIRKFEPLKQLKSVNVFAKGNPFTNKKTIALSGLCYTSSKESIGAKMKNFGIVYLKESKQAKELKESLLKAESKKSKQPKPQVKDKSKQKQSEVKPNSQNQSNALPQPIQTIQQSNRSSLNQQSLLEFFTRNISNDTDARNKQMDFSNDESLSMHRRCLSVVSSAGLRGSLRRGPASANQIINLMIRRNERFQNSQSSSLLPSIYKRKLEIESDEQKILEQFSEVDDDEIELIENSEELQEIEGVFYDENQSSFSN